MIGIGAPTAPLDEKLGTQGVRFKTAELNWIGRIDSLINIVFTWHTSPVKTVADAMKMESKLSGTGVGSTARDARPARGRLRACSTSACWFSA